MNEAINKIYTGYLPRAHQDQLHRSLKRFNVLVCHRRFGKTVFAVNEIIDQAIRNEKRNPQYAYVAPNYGQAKRIAWQLFKDYCEKLPNLKINEAELRVEFDNGHSRCKIFLLGAENPGSIRGIYLDGVVIDEYAEADPVVWSQAIRPTLSDRSGWAIFIGTPKGQNHFYDVYKIAQKNKNDWFSKIYRASETKLIPFRELEAAKTAMSESEYKQEFECSFTAAMVGSYYGSHIEKAEREGRITKVPYERGFPVFTGWDLGIGDTTSIWFAQLIGKEIHLIDYVENCGAAIDWYVRELKARDYMYDYHYLPHDASARELQTGKSRVDALRTLGLNNTIVLPRHKVEDGINAVRMVLSKCWFDEKKCERGLNALKNYEQKWDSKNKTFSNRPHHNWASHGADGFRYLVMGFNEDRHSTYKKPLPTRAEYDYDPFLL